MEFHTIESMAERISFKGDFLPTFKFRFTENYLDNINREQYEKELFVELFSNEELDFVINTNKYPFNFGSNLEQKIVWIRYSDPGIEQIQRFVEEFYPSSDWIIYLNKPKHRSIKSILHYHVVLRPQSEPLKLKKLITIFRHGHRQPITRFPVIESFIGANIDNSKDAETKICDAHLLECGFNHGVEFGLELKKIYQLNDSLTYDFVSSPVKRCVDTTKAVSIGLGIDLNEIKTDPVLKFVFSIQDYYDFDTYLKENYSELYSQYLSLADEIETHLGYRIKTPMDLYETHNGFLCYTNLGIDMKQFFDDNDHKKLLVLMKTLYNLFYEYCIKNIPSFSSSDKIINDLILIESGCDVRNSR